MARGWSTVEVAGCDMNVAVVAHPTVDQDKIADEGRDDTSEEPGVA